MKKKKTIKKKRNIKDDYKFTWLETWFLEKLEYKPNMVLEVYLIKGKKKPLEEVVVGKVSLGQAHPVVWDSRHRVVMRFFQPLTFQRLDESFAFEKDGVFTGERYRLYSKSEYLNYYSKVTFGIVDQPIRHYSMACADDIIDVLTTEPPEIEKIQR